MKIIHLKKLLYAAGLCTLCASCAGSPVKEAWSSAGTFSKGTIAAGTVGVDSVSGRDSLEREIAGLLPLMLLEKGYAPAETGKAADFTADVSVIEREYMEDWRAKKSLSVEVRIWPAKKTAVPLAAGRVMVFGNKSLASSKTTSALLRSALSKALSALKRSRRR
jgi:hypothetical protein